MMIEALRPGAIVAGPMLREPIEILAAVPLGGSIKIIGKELTTKLVREPVLTPAQLDQLTISPAREPFDGDPARFRLGIEALRLSLAYENAPDFSFSIARVDPLPHQLEGVLASVKKGAPPC